MKFIKKIKKIKYILKGIGTYLPASVSKWLPSHQNQFYNRGQIRVKAYLAEESYTTWLRHLIKLDQAGIKTDFDSLAEIGPGDSFGLGLAAILSGANTYYAFDVSQNTSVEANLALLDDLVLLFKNRHPIPDNNIFPKTKPYLNDYFFPSGIITDEKLKFSLNTDRIEKIREAIRSSSDKNQILHEKEITIRYISSWSADTEVLKKKVELIISNAVMEHVDDLNKVYQAAYNWLFPSGLISEIIDYKSHGTASDWNGQWSYSDFIWKLIRGRSHYLINRLPHSYHLKVLESIGFKIISNEIYKDPAQEIKDEKNKYNAIYNDYYKNYTSIEKNDLFGKYKEMINEDDLKIMASHIIVQKN
jgi:SAM-dependent methyltransferase